MKTKTIYVANDGKEFDNQADCKAWESTESLRKAIGKVRNEYFAGPSSASISGFLDFLVLKLSSQFIFAERNGQSQHTCDNNR